MRTSAVKELLLPAVMVGTGTGLNDVERIIAQALDFRRQASAEARQELEIAIRQFIQINGFRDPVMARKPSLIRHMRAVPPSIMPFLFAPLLKIWVESCQELRRIAEDFLETITPEVTVIIHDGGHRTEVWTTAQMMELVETFQGSQPTFGEDEIKLMLCCLTGYSIVSDEQLEEVAINDWQLETVKLTQKGIHQEEECMIWTQWLDELRTLPPEAPEWARMNEFIQALQELVEAKRQENNAAHQQLQQALENLIMQAGNELTYFSFTEVLDWEAQHVPLAEVAVCTEHVLAWQEVLTKHQALRQLPPAESFVEDQRRRSEFSQLQANISELHTQLSNIFQLHLAAEESPIQVPAEMVATESVVTSEDEGEETLSEEAAEPESPLIAEVDIAEPQPTASTEEAVIEVELPNIDEIEDEEVQPLAVTEDESPETELVEETEASIPEPEALVVSEVEDTSVPPFLPAEEIVESVSEIETHESGSLPLLDVVEEEAPATPITKIEETQHAAREIARLLESEDRPEHWHAFLWALIAEDDLPGAYWLARSLEATGQTSPVPDWLLAAAQGARWLTFESDFLFDDLLEIVSDHLIPTEGSELMINLSAALHSSLIAPATGLTDWLIAPKVYPSIHELVNVINEFCSNGQIALRPEDLLGAAGEDQRNSNLREAISKAQQCLDEAPKRLRDMGWATTVWDNWVGPKGGLHEILIDVSKDRRNKFEIIYQSLDQWQNPDYFFDQINQIRKGLAKSLPTPLRRKLNREVEKICSVAKVWYDLVKREHEIASRGDWVFERVRNLRTKLQKILPDVESTIIELGASDQPIHIAASAKCLWRAIKQLQKTLSVIPNESKVIQLTINNWDWLFRQADGLDTALGNRLLWFPELILDDEGLPLKDDFSKIPIALRNAYIQEHSLRSALDGWLQKHDYRFVEDKMLVALGTEKDYTEISRHYREMLDGSRVTWARLVSDSRDAIEQAVVDGIIPEEERSKYGDTIVTASESKDILNFSPKYSELQQISRDLSLARRERLAVLDLQWQELQKRLTNTETELMMQLNSLWEDTFSREDTRSIEEYLGHLKKVLDAGDELEDSWLVPFEGRDVLREFLEAMPYLEKWIAQARDLKTVAAEIKLGRSRANIDFASVLEKRREEAEKAIIAWQRLKQESAGSLNYSQLVSAILRYLGFDLEANPERAVALQDRGDGWLYLQTQMSAGDLTKPIPQFGSEAKGRYELVCFWGKPGAETIADRLKKLRLDNKNVILFYLSGPLTLQQRYDFRRLDKPKLSLVVLDELLLTFLAQEKDARSRLFVFMKCTLPFATLNPYKPAGSVPPEMHFGREDMAEALKSSTGSCLVFGGRQLGKSAILRHVRWQFNHPEQEEYAWVVDMGVVFDPEAGKEAQNIWHYLRDRFKEENLLPSRITTENTTEIRRYIREITLKVPGRRILMMFDEADNFLDADQRDGFRQVIAFRELMLETDNRFKVIFAGLHDVQRFLRIPNQPFAQFGTPICVGPLDPKAAQQLVRQPLETLGYHFDSDALVLRILSYTNYHPGLIQLFCQKLLVKLQENTRNASIPYPIKQSYVETVYRQIRKDISERFDLTLKLDLRYQVIAWTLIEDQIEGRDSFAKTYRPNQILEMVRYWWPNGFNKTSTEELRGLLDEMRGLGVLVRNLDGHYQLRSPNLVRLMGTNEDIRDSLLKLPEKQLPAPSDASNHHAPLDDTAHEYSPLTYPQASSLAVQQFGVGLVFASEALGLSRLPKAFKQLIPPHLPKDLGLCVQIPQANSTGSKLESWLASFLKDHQAYERLIVYYRPDVGANPKDLEELVETALNFCNHQKPQKRWMRILFLLNPKATWPWLLIPRERREKLEDQADAAPISPHLWNLPGIRQRLKRQAEIYSDDEARQQQILQITGGWPFLLDELFSRCVGKDDPDPRPLVLDLESQLHTSNSELRQRFRKSLGLEVSEATRRVIEFIYQGKQVTDDQITPEWMGGTPALEIEECESAIQYLERLSCVIRSGDALLVEPTVARIIVL